MRNELLKKRREKGRLDLVECGIGDRKGNIYINEDLSTDARKLRARELRNCGWKYGNLDVVGVSETWLDKQLDLGLVNLVGYSLV